MKIKEVYYIYPPFLHRQPDDGRKPLAGLEDNSCLRIRHLAWGKPLERETQCTLQDLPRSYVGTVV